MAQQNNKADALNESVLEAWKDHTGRYDPIELVTMLEERGRFMEALKEYRFAIDMYGKTKDKKQKTMIERYIKLLKRLKRDEDADLVKGAP